MDNLNEKEYEGNKLFVNKFQKKSERKKALKSEFDKKTRGTGGKQMGNNLYVKYIDEKVRGIEGRVQEIWRNCFIKDRISELSR